MSRVKRQPVKVGEKYGRLTVLSCAGRNNDGRQMFLCKCECGKETTVIGKHLQSGNTKSCGCYKHDAGIKANTTHGLSKTNIYRIWASMKDRCTRNNCSAYPNYGGRGITVCQEWLDSFEVFYAWATENGYEEGLSIDRIDVNGNYEPSNCRWVTMEAQAHNKRTNVFITYNGETHTLKQWSDIVGVNYFTMQNRYKAGKSPAEILGKGE